MRDINVVFLELSTPLTPKVHFTLYVAGQTDERTVNYEYLMRFVSGKLFALLTQHAENKMTNA